MRADRARAEEEQAQSYAGVQQYATEWGYAMDAADQAIIERWSGTALRRVKRRAWQIAEQNGWLCAACHAPEANYLHGPRPSGVMCSYPYGYHKFERHGRSPRRT